MVRDSGGRVAYFSMEYGLENSMNTYNGGLGILSGDVVKALADLDAPAVGVTQLNDQGLGKQTLDENGHQSMDLDPWDVEGHLEKLDATVTLQLHGKDVTIGAWRYDVESDYGGTVPVVFLDTHREDNDQWASEITRRLYSPGRDERFRLAQELVLGIGGLRMLEALGYEVDTYHMNEGHACFLALELLGRNDMDADAVREQTVFTTHTPVAAAHEEYDYDLIRELLGEFVSYEELSQYAGKAGLHTTRFGFNMSRYANAVSKRHQWVTEEMFPEHAADIEAITNGAHVPTWVGDHIADLFDEYIDHWRKYPSKLAHATLIEDDDLWDAHQRQKADLIEYIGERSDVEFERDTLTIGFARRAVPYKRAPLLFNDLDRLREIVARVGDVQVVFAGKAFPGDPRGKAIIEEIYHNKYELEGAIPVTYLENYDMEMGLKLTSGVDVWLNNPRRPREASGTSGMKAAFNGVPQFSTLDGWWVEGHIEGQTGWRIGPEPFGPREQRMSDEMETLVDATSLYDQLESAVLPTYYEDRADWIDVMRNAIAFNGSRYHARRMMEEYLAEAY